MRDGRIVVLFATPMLDRGGPDRVLFEIINTIDRRRFAPHVMVSQRDGYYLGKLPADVPVHFLEGSRNYPVFSALRHVRALKPDIVLGTLRMVLTLGAIAPFLPRSTRLVLRPASPVSADFEALIKIAPLKQRIARRFVISTLRRADAVVCQSWAMQTDLNKLFGTSSNLHVVANPIDVHAVAKASSSMVTLKGAPALVSCGRLVPLKAYEVLLESMPALRARHPDVHLTILGDGPERERLERLVEKLGLAKTVTLAGYTKEPWPLLRAADLFVLTSRYDAFCNAALEALACGTPVVLTDCPGANCELVAPGLNGRLVKSMDPARIADEISVAIDTQWDRAAIRADVERRFASSRIVAAYEDVLSSVVRPREMRT